MSLSPKEKAARLFKLERSPSTGVFKRRLSATPSASSSFDDALSQGSSETAVDDEYYTPDKNNGLSKNISATVRLKARTNSGRSVYTTVDAIRSKPELSQYPPLTRTTSPLSKHSYTPSEGDTYAPSVQNKSSGDQGLGHYGFLKLLSNFEILEIGYMILNTLSRFGFTAIKSVKSSKYVSSDPNDGKIHFQSFSYGFLAGLSMILLKPLIMRAMNYMATMAINIGICVAILGIISLSISRGITGQAKVTGESNGVTHNSKPTPSGSKKFDPKEYYGSRRQILDPIKSSQIPLLNPIHPRRADSAPLYGVETRVLPTLKHIQSAQRSERGFSHRGSEDDSSIVPALEEEDNKEDCDDYDDEEEDVNDDVRSLFSVQTAANAHPNMLNNKKTYKNFIEQTKILKQTS